VLLLWGAAPGIARAQASAEKLATSGRDQNFLGWMIDASGPIGLLILGLSFYLVALVVWMFLRYRKPVAIPPALLKETQELLSARAYTDAYQRLAASESFFARVLAAGVRKLPSGLSSARDAMALANEDASMEMEHRTTYLATVGTLGPMIGLVGTVYGMILAFRVIAVAGSSPDAADLAAGISTALFATLEGIAISIPAIYFYAFFRNRIGRLSLDVEMACDGLLEQFAQGLRTPHPLASAAAPPGPMRKGLPEPE
jgi:biopolymer transport protein ExbB